MKTRTTGTQSRGVSETLGVVVLVGMTIFVTGALGMGVLLMGQQEAEKSAEISFVHQGDRLVLNYQDGTDRVAGRLYVDGPENNVSWAELDDRVGPEGTVTQGTLIEVGANTAYGSTVAETDRFDIVYFSGSGERFVLATWNEPEEGNSPLEDDGPGGPGGPDGPGGPGGPEP